MPIIREVIDMSTPWKLDDGRTIILKTPEEFKAYPDGTIFTSIFGDTKEKGKDYIDGDTRYGHLAYGIEEK